MKLVLAEKPSVAQSIAKVLGATKREDGYLEGNGYVVSWCVGHLVELSQPEAYDEKYNKWAYADLPIFPDQWKYQVSASTKKQFGILKKLMARKDVESLVCATDAGREGELIFRLVYQQAGCRKPFERLWICQNHIFVSSTAEAMFSLSSYRSRAVRNGEMPRIAATSLPPIPCLRYASHSCSVRFSVLTSTLGSCRMCSGILSPSSRAGDRGAWAGCAHCTADTANCAGWVLPCAGV